jgi:hypothetical protein
MGMGFVETTLNSLMVTKKICTFINTSPFIKWGSGICGHYLLFIIVLLFSSCTSVPYKEPPPNDIAPLDSFPSNLRGDYVFNEMKEPNGKPIPPVEIECRKKWVVLEITKNKLTFHEWITSEYKAGDTAIRKINDSLIYITKDGKEESYPYIYCNHKYTALEGDRGMGFTLSDTVILKTVNNFFFLSVNFKGIWICMVLKYIPNNILQWYTTFHFKKEAVLEKKLKYIMKPEKATFYGKEIECFNPNSKMMMYLIQQGIYKKFMSFKLKK